MIAERDFLRDTVTSIPEFWLSFNDLAQRGWIRWIGTISDNYTEKPIANGNEAAAVYSQILRAKLKVTPIRNFNGRKYIICDPLQVDILHTSKSNVTDTKIGELSKNGIHFIDFDQYPNNEKRGLAYFAAYKPVVLPDPV